MWLFCSPIKTSMTFFSVLLRLTQPLHVSRRYACKTTQLKTLIWMALFPSIITRRLLLCYLDFESLCLPLHFMFYTVPLYCYFALSSLCLCCNWIEIKLKLLVGAYRLSHLPFFSYNLLAWNFLCSNCYHHLIDTVFIFHCWIVDCPIKSPNNNTHTLVVISCCNIMFQEIRISFFITNAIVGFYLSNNIKWSFILHLLSFFITKTPLKFMFMYTEKYCRHLSVSNRACVLYMMSLEEFCCFLYFMAAAHFMI